MKKFIPVFMLLIIAALISISCATPPPTTDEGIVPTIISAVEQLREPKEKAQAARQRAIDFESPEYFPSEWETLETQYRVLDGIPMAENMEELINRWNGITESFNEIFEKTLPLYAQAREDEILAKRDELIATGFTREFPQYLENADNITLEALDQYEAEDYYTARDTAAKALNEYELLLIGASVFLKRQEIIDRDFAKYDEENFSGADAAAASAQTEFDAGNREVALTNAEEALNRYNLVLSNGWTHFVDEQKEITVSERALALEDRANIASRDLWQQAETHYNSAEEYFALERFHDAGNQYTEAQALYILARQDTLEKRQRAEAALRTAGERIEGSNEAAIEAERIIEGGQK